MSLLPLGHVTDEWGVVWVYPIRGPKPFFLAQTQCSRAVRVWAGAGIEQDHHPRAMRVAGTAALLLLYCNRAVEPQQIAVARVATLTCACSWDLQPPLRFSNHLRQARQGSSPVARQPLWFC